MPDEKPKPEPEGTPAPAAPEKPGRPSKKKEEEKEEPKAPRAPKKLEGVKEDFRYIVRMANTDLDGTRSVGYALTAISGVGIRVSEAVADLAGVPRAERLGNLSDEQTDKIEATLSKLGELFPPWMVNRPKDWESGLDLHLVGAEVEVRLRDDINLMKMIRSYKGVRHETGQKVRGQRTRSNGRTGLTVGVTKKAALEAAKAEKKEGVVGRSEVLPCEVRAAVASVGSGAHQGGERAPEEIRVEEQEGTLAVAVRLAAVPAAGAGIAGTRADGGQAGGEGTRTVAASTRPARIAASRRHDARRRPRPRRGGDPVAATADPDVPEGTCIHAASSAAIHRSWPCLHCGTAGDDPRDPREPHGGERHFVRRALGDLQRPPPGPADGPDPDAAARGRRRG